jgi:hypothetical protein
MNIIIGTDWETYRKSEFSGQLLSSPQYAWGQKLKSGYQ